MGKDQLKPGGCIIVGFVDRESELGRHYAANREKSKFYAQATFFSAPEVITRLQDAGFDIALIKQTLIPGEETGTLRDGYGQGAFVGIQGIKLGIKSTQ